MPKKDEGGSTSGSRLDAETLRRPIPLPRFMADGNDLLTASLAACLLNWRWWALWAIALGSLTTLSLALVTRGEHLTATSFMVWASLAWVRPLAAVSAFRFMEARARRAMPSGTSLLHLNLSILLTVGAIELTSGRTIWMLPKAAAAVGFGPLGTPFLLIFAVAVIDTFFLIAQPVVILGGKAPLDALFSGASLSGWVQAAFWAGLALQLFIESLPPPPPDLLMAWPRFVVQQAKLGPECALAYIVYTQRLREVSSAE